MTQYYIHPEIDGTPDATEACDEFDTAVSIAEELMQEFREAGYTDIVIYIYDGDEENGPNDHLDAIWYNRN